jgi:predicted ferric reductase
VQKIVPETDTVNSVYITGKNIERLKVKPGQFIIVRFLAKNYIGEAHPFSISEIPKNNTIRMSIKAVGDFTKTIGTIKPGTKVFIEGPYGIFTKEIAGDNNKLLFIAGGIGITPIRAVIEDSLRAGKDCILLYGNRFIKEIALKTELENLAAQKHYPIYHILSDEEMPAAEKGFVDKEKIQRLVTDIVERDVFLCGPPIMMSKVRPILKELGVPESKIHFELFSLN